jgi:hypothetical protein
LSNVQMGMKPEVRIGRFRHQCYVNVKIDEGKEILG